MRGGACIDVNNRIVDPKAVERTHQMLDRRDKDRADIERGGKARVIDILRTGGQLHHRIAIDAAKDNPLVHACRTERQRNLSARVKADANPCDFFCKGTLNNHLPLLYRWKPPLLRR